MICIKKFESFLSRPVNEDYYNLSEFLIDNFMDDLEIYAYEDVKPSDKFWAFSDFKDEYQFPDFKNISSKLSDFKGTEIKSIVVFNLSESELDKIYNTLDNEFLNRVFDFIGFKLDTTWQSTHNELEGINLYDIKFQLK
jgi:hypothetical protein